MSMEHWCNDNDRKTKKYWERNLSLCQFVHHKSHIGVLGLKSDLLVEMLEYTLRYGDV